MHCCVAHMHISMLRVLEICVSVEASWLTERLQELCIAAVIALNILRYVKPVVWLSTIIFPSIVYKYGPVLGTFSRPLYKRWGLYYTLTTLVLIVTTITLTQTLVCTH